MIKQEHFDLNGRDFIRTYSDAGRYVVRDGVAYSEACDPAELGRTYTEGEIIDDGSMPTDEATIADYEAALAELGVTE
jgi:hypothetical protein